MARRTTIATSLLGRTTVLNDEYELVARQMMSYGSTPGWIAQLVDKKSEVVAVRTEYGELILTVVTELGELVDGIMARNMKILPNSVSP